MVSVFLVVEKWNDAGFYTHEGPYLMSKVVEWSIIIYHAGYLNTIWNDGEAGWLEGTAQVILLDFFTHTFALVTCHTQLLSVLWSISELCWCGQGGML